MPAKKLPNDGSNRVMLVDLEQNNRQFRVTRLTAKEILEHPANKEKQRYCTVAEFDEIQAANRIRRRAEESTTEPEIDEELINAAVSTILDRGDEGDLTKNGRVTKAALEAELERSVTSAELKLAQSD